MGRRIEYQARAVMPCGWGVKGGMVREWAAGLSVCVIPLLSRALSERFSDGFTVHLIIGRYTYKCPISYLVTYLLWQTVSESSRDIKGIVLSPG